MREYLLKSAYLGIGWFVVLLIPPWTRGWLLAEGSLEAGAINIALLLVTGLAIALLFRRWIASSLTLRGDVLRATVLPYFGCLIYLTLRIVVALISRAIFGGLGDSLEMLTLYPWGFVYALAACFVVIPFGYFCQQVMQPAARKSLNKKSDKNNQ